MSSTKHVVRADQQGPRDAGPYKLRLSNEVVSWDPDAGGAFTEATLAVVDGEGPRTVEEGKAVYFDGDGTIYEATARGGAVDWDRARAVGIVVESGGITSPASGRVALGGIVPIPAAVQNGVAWAYGDTIYLEDNGNLTSTVPDPITGTDFIMAMGRCANTPAGGIAQLILNPWVEPLRIVSQFGNSHPEVTAVGWDKATGHMYGIDGVLQAMRPSSTTDNTPTVVQSYTTPATTARIYRVWANFLARDNITNEVLERTFIATVLKTAPATLTLKNVEYLTDFREDPTWDTDVLVSGDDIQFQVTGDATNTTWWQLHWLVQSR